MTKEEKFDCDFAEFKELLASYLKDVQRLRRRNEMMTNAFASAVVTTICWLLIHWKGA